MSAQVTPRHRIYIDKEACGNAIECLKCVHVCHDNGPNCIGFVNETIPPVGDKAPKTLQEIKHVVFGAFMFKCNACGDCVAICPNNAITLVKAETLTPSVIVYNTPFEIRCTTLKDGTMAPEAQAIYDAMKAASKPAHKE